jgi:hypothetical protein
MSRSRHPDIRALLRAVEDGMTVPAIAAALSAKYIEPIRLALKNMPDAYIDRWDGPIQGQYAAVWCVVVPPEDCPHPKGDDA